MTERRGVFLDDERKYPRKSAFTNGLAVGFGIGCFATFAALLVTAFYYSQTTTQAFESTLSSFSLPLVYFFTLGILCLVVGVFWDRDDKQLKF